MEIYTNNEVHLLNTVKKNLFQKQIRASVISDNDGRQWKESDTKKSINTDSVFIQEIKLYVTLSPPDRFSYLESSLIGDLSLFLTCFQNYQSTIILNVHYMAKSSVIESQTCV